MPQALSVSSFAEARANMEAHAAYVGIWVCASSQTSSFCREFERVAIGVLEQCYQADPTLVDDLLFAPMENLTRRGFEDTNALEVLHRI